MIEISDTDGYLHDPADKTPAVQGFYSGGTPMWIDHYANGELQNSVCRDPLPTPRCPDRRGRGPEADRPLQQRRVGQRKELPATNRRGMSTTDAARDNGRFGPQALGTGGGLCIHHLRHDRTI